MINKSFLKAWDYSDQATLVESFTQMLQGCLCIVEKLQLEKQSPFLPAEAESREKTEAKQWSSSSTTARGWRHTKHVPLPALSLDHETGWGWLNGKHEAMASSRVFWRVDNSRLKLAFLKRRTKTVKLWCSCIHECEFGLIEIPNHLWVSSFSPYAVTHIVIKASTNHK